MNKPRPKQFELIGKVLVCRDRDGGLPEHGHEHGGHSFPCTDKGLKDLFEQLSAYFGVYTLELRR